MRVIFFLIKLGPIEQSCERSDSI
ncbi:unnamed protein product [Debaryomyces tyrocola]|nr:unnamed protein product [Debaryomyces tyrocola]